ncbi:MAG: hypothetical protein JNM80_14005 [Phycisphaerae bacterium]|nr:hypothetical protein [Phycisphaerae bacterium]
MSTIAMGAPARARAVVAMDAARWFYAFAGVVMLGCVLVGFQQFFFHGRAYPSRPITPPIKWLVIAHGVSMSLWMVLMIVQPMLVAMRKRRVHMAVGKAGALLALAIVVLGVMVSVAQARVLPPDARIMGYEPKPFLAIPLLSVVFFGAMVGLAIWQRRRPAVHRALMLSATLGTLSAALNRIDALNNLYVGTIWETVFGPFLAAVVLGVVLLGIRCVVVRRLDRELALGVGLVTAWSLLIVVVARTEAWYGFASLLV